MNFNKNMSPEDIIKIMDEESGRPEFRLAVGEAYLQRALHKELLDNQNKFQKSQLTRTTLLVIATWIMAGANILLALFRVR
jgi:hypothetical protein